jgi:hypothetical protein
LLQNEQRRTSCLSVFMNLWEIAYKARVDLTR